MSKRNTKRVKLLTLFQWNHKLDIYDEKGEKAEELYQRIVNEVNFEKARLSAVRISRKTRLALRDENSDEHASLLEALENFTNDQLINLSILQQYEDFNSQARDLAKTKMPKPLKSEAPMEAVENYENAVDTFDERFDQEVAKIIGELIQQSKDKMAKLPDEEIRIQATKSWENQICTSVSNEHFIEFLAYLGTYEDPEFKIPTFESFEEFNELSTQVRKQIVDGYRKLTLTQEELKNSQRATPSVLPGESLSS